jgi:hypothetical protein
LEISEPDLDLLISSDDLNVKSMKDDGTGGGEFVVFLGVMRLFVVIICVEILTQPI